ncbi:hypothetical protein [Sphingobacterium sp. LRF_L2]|uniref:hypothetical protein n=1 Tax=Sphingobacterium sp. LRF_L2 TaxID=3369421 RepID=UPI003F6491B1
MSENPHNSGTLALHVRTSGLITSDVFENSIPKNIQILSANLNTERSFWMFSDNWTDSLKAGVYLVKIIIASAKEVEKIVEILPQKETRINFDIREEQIQIDVLSFPSSNRNYDRIFSKKNKRYKRKIVVIDWIYDEGKLKQYQHEYFSMSFLEIDSPLIISQMNIMRITEFQITAIKSVFVCLPPMSELSLLSNSSDIITNLKISIDLPNKIAQTLLYLMNKGDSDKAETLFKIRQAELLLHDKVRDPIGAAVGGYFLLSTGQLEFLHEWPNNLANWFEWLPDGPIIHAWQLIKSKDVDNPMIQIRLLEAVSRGIPLFTEGLRLLYEGLTLLHNHLHSDNFEVRLALEKVKKHMEVADLSKVHTTLIGRSDLILKIVNVRNY